MSSNAHREHSLRTVVSDVLVVGGGAAGSRAAVAAAEVGARTALVLKGDLGRSGSTCFPARGPHGSAYQAADGCSVADGDSPDEHYRDIVGQPISAQYVKVDVIEPFMKNGEAYHWRIEAIFLEVRILGLKRHTIGKFYLDKL